MRAVMGIALVLCGCVAFAQEQVIAEGTDKGPKVEVKIPDEPKEPLIQTYHTVNGDLAAVVTPEKENQYVFVPVQQAYQTQNPQDREADVPINESNWVFFGW